MESVKQSPDLKAFEISRRRANKHASKDMTRDREFTNGTVTLQSDNEMKETREVKLLTP